MLWASSALFTAALGACAGAPPPPPPLVIEPARTPEPVAVPVATGTAPPPTSKPQVAAPAAAFLLGEANQATTPPFGDEQPTAPLTKRWAVNVGKTTFRTTMAHVNGTIVIGTHGASLTAQNEAADAVYVLDAKTGATVRKIATPGGGDKDVGGVAVAGDRVYFTSDNGGVSAASLVDGKVAWTTKLKGKVRPAPALADLDGDGKPDVVVGDEDGQLHALSGATGKALWTAPTQDNEYGAHGFIGAAAIVDVDGDGKDDVIAGARDGAMVAYKGSTGAPLWEHEEGSGIHASPLVLDVDGDGRKEVLAAWSYGEVALLDVRTGHLRWQQRLAQDGAGIEGLFGTPTPMPGGLVVAGTSWWGGQHGAPARPRRGAPPAQSGDGVLVVGQLRRELRTYEGRVTASAVITDWDNDGQPDAILGTEAGDLLRLKPSGARIRLMHLGGAIEASAMLADVDGDGQYELLVASNDGLLTCFATPSRAKPTVGRFRGPTPDNRGDLGALDFGWKPDPDSGLLPDVPEPPRAPPPPKPSVPAPRPPPPAPTGPRVIHKAG